MSNDFGQAMRRLRTAPGVGREELDEIKAGLMAMAELAHPGEAERIRAAETRHEQYLTEARERGISNEDAEKILASVSGDVRYLTGDPHAFATAVLSAVAK